MTSRGVLWYCLGMRYEDHDTTPDAPPMPLRDMTREEALAVLGIDEITPDVKVALAILAPWWSPSDCKKMKGRYTTSDADAWYRTGKTWERWDKGTEEWVQGVPVVPLHFIPTIKG